MIKKEKKRKTQRLHGLMQKTMLRSAIISSAFMGLNEAITVSEVFRLVIKYGDG